MLFRSEPLKVEERGPGGNRLVYNKAYELEVSAGDHVLFKVPESTYELRLWCRPDPGTVFLVEQSPQSSETEEVSLVWTPWEEAGDDANTIFVLVPGNFFKLTVSVGVFKGHAVFWRG